MGNLEKETVMKTKAANALIVGLVLVGTIFLGNLAGIGKDGELMPTLFLCFFAVIIAIQVVPAMMLFGYLFKELFRKVPKSKAEAGARGGNEG
jgi:hypothetical protein